jgi:hypothetical protein
MGAADEVRLLPADLEHLLVYGFGLRLRREPLHVLLHQVQVLNFTCRPRGGSLVV